MEIRTSNRTAAPAQSRQLGGRKLTSDHARADFAARQFTPRADFNRFEPVMILRRVAQRLPERSGERWTQALLSHIEFLVARTSERDWQDGQPVVWISRARTAQMLGITAGQVTARENQLMRLGAVTFNDSANHKRYGRRCPDTGRILDARGVNLAPLGQMLPLLRQMDGIAADEIRRQSIARQAYTVLRRKIRGIFAGMAEGVWPVPEDAALDDLVIAFEALLPPRLTRTTPAEDVEGCVDQLEAFLATLEAPLEPGVETQTVHETVPETAPEPCAAPSQPLKAAENRLNEEKIHPTEPINLTPGSDLSTTHRIQTESLLKDTGSPGAADNRPDPSGPDDRYGREGCSGRGDGGADRHTDHQMASEVASEAARDAGPRGDRRPLARSLPPMRADIRDEIPIAQVMAAMPDDIRAQLNRMGNDRPDWGHLALVADELVPEIGISPSAWDEAKRLMGPDTAALAVLIIAAKRQCGLVWQPGGYLRGMTRKWASGALNLRPALFGLAGMG